MNKMLTVFGKIVLASLDAPCYESYESDLVLSHADDEGQNPFVFSHDTPTLHTGPFWPMWHRVHLKWTGDIPSASLAGHAVWL